MQRNQVWIVIRAGKPGAADAHLRLLLPRSQKRPRAVVVVRPDEAALAREELKDEDVNIIVEPKDLGSAPGLLFPLSRVRAHDAHAHVLIVPPGHPFPDGEREAENLRRAARIAARGHDRLVVIGAVPSGQPEGRSWIVPGAPLTTVSGRGAYAVERFVDDPDPAQVEELRAHGALRNTFVIAAKVELLWKLVEKHLPSYTDAFGRYQAAIGTPAEHEVLAKLYEELSPAELGSQILADAPRMAVVRLEPEDQRRGAGPPPLHTSVAA